jgi:phasin
MDVDTKIKSKTVAPEQYRELAEKGVAQSKKTFDTVSAATGQTAGLMKKCYSNAVKGAQDYSNKVVEFTQANTNAAFDFAQRISGVKSPSEFVELSTEHARQQLETLTNQTTQLAALAQRVSLATAEPLKTGFANHLTGAET